jgi:RNA polymerase sigma factor (sigma-70 family)
MTAEQLFSDNIALVHYMVQKHARYNSTNYEDYVQNGCIGLWLAAQRYNENMGATFSTFAASYILGYIRRQYSDFECSLLNLTREVIHSKTEDNLRPVCVSLQDVVYIDDAGNELELGDIIADENDMIETLIENISFEEKLRQKLKPKEIAIIRLTIAGKNQRQIAEVVGDSRANISRIKARIKKKLAE